MERNNVLDPETVQAARNDQNSINRHSFPSLAPHLTDRILAAAPVLLTHHLTLDAGLQAKLEVLAVRAAREAGDRQSVAILVADHRTGEILASVGSAAYQADQRQGFVDMTQAVRSPGSTLKPLIYGMAFEQGLAHPETMIEDRPTAFGRYVPQNFDGQFRGTIRIRDALKLSLNIPAVALTEALGPTAVLARMRRAGTKPQLPGGTPGLAIALGGIGLTLQDLTQLYGSIARGGQAITLVTDTDSKPAKNEKDILSRVAAWQVADILSGMTPPPSAPMNRLAYKTGTSYGHRDAWAIGFDGRHVIGVWMGRADGTPVPGAFGADLAAPILFEAFSRLKPALESLPPPPPETLIVPNAALPRPLQNFRPRSAVFNAAKDAPKVAFPPDGANLVIDGALSVRVREGKPPFTWLADGRPLVTGSYEREEVLPLPGLGFVRLSVVDANGQAANVQIRLE
jgi:penicillin-binding protein 1C